jgi:hypothetical protein
MASERAPRACDPMSRRSRIKFRKLIRALDDAQVAPNGFVLRPGEPTNPRAWLGVAPLVMAKAYPVRVELPRLLEEEEDWTIGFWLHWHRTAEGRRNWRRVLLPMLLEEAKKRGLDV